MLSRRHFSAAIAASLTAASPTDPASLSITEALALIRKRKLTPVELAKACQNRIEVRNPTLHALITVLSAQAMDAAKNLKPSDAARQPLHGIPIALKDLYDTAGILTTAASALWAGRVPTQDATVVKRLKDAGAILIAKANMDEFAYNFTAETSHYGVAQNPWKLGYSPGGSSGGSAVAVAAGLCLGALGSDTGGSIRLPAAFCGITGFKPSYGRIPADGVAPLAWSLDHVGPITRTAADAALLCGVLSGRDEWIRPVKVKDLRLGAPRNPYWQDLETSSQKLFDEAATTLRKLTRDLRDVTLPKLPGRPEWPVLPLTYGNVISAESYAFHEKMIAAHPEKYHPTTRANILGGKTVSAPDYIGARREMDRLRATVESELFRDADILVMPLAPGPAFALKSNPSLVYLRNTAPWNLYGLPAICIPCGFTADNLPLGVQLVGKPGRDHEVLALATAYQQVTDFHQRRPAAQS